MAVTEQMIIPGTLMPVVATSDVGVLTADQAGWQRAVLRAQLPRATKLIALALASHALEGPSPVVAASADGLAVVPADGPTCAICAPGLVVLAEETGYSRSHVQRQIRSLRQRGWLVTIGRPAAGRPARFSLSLPAELLAGQPRGRSPVARPATRRSAGAGVGGAAAGDYYGAEGGEGAGAGDAYAGAASPYSGAAGVEDDDYYLGAEGDEMGLAASAGLGADFDLGADDVDAGVDAATDNAAAATDNAAAAAAAGSARSGRPGNRPSAAARRRARVTGSAVVKAMSVNGDSSVVSMLGRVVPERRPVSSADLDGYGPSASNAGPFDVARRKPRPRWTETVRRHQPISRSAEALFGDPVATGPSDADPVRPAATPPAPQAPDSPAPAPAAVVSEAQPEPAVVPRSEVEPPASPAADTVSTPDPTAVGAESAAEAEVRPEAEATPRPDVPPQPEVTPQPKAEAKAEPTGIDAHAAASRQVLDTLSQAMRCEPEELAGAEEKMTAVLVRGQWAATEIAMHLIDTLGPGSGASLDEPAEQVLRRLEHLPQSPDSCLCRSCRSWLPPRPPVADPGEKGSGGTGSARGDSSTTAPGELPDLETIARAGAVGAAQASGRPGQSRWASSYKRRRSGVA